MTFHRVTLYQLWLVPDPAAKSVSEGLTCGTEESQKGRNFSVAKSSKLESIAKHQYEWVAKQ